jgi:hypothetical protein
VSLFSEVVWIDVVAVFQVHRGLNKIHVRIWVFSSVLSIFLACVRPWAQSLASNVCHFLTFSSRT